MVHRKVENLYGLVLAGGKSTRMKKDKSSLVFHGVSQARYCYELLLPFCEKVFLSRRRDQQKDNDGEEPPQIHDEPPFTEIGPLGGILSAMHQYPQKAWFVLACDLPLVNHATLEFLVNNRDPKKLATAFESVHDKLPEPLCAVYEARVFKELVIYFERGKYCPRKFMLLHDVRLLLPPDKMALENINTPDELSRAIDLINDREWPPWGK